jgi:hypothetical protein
MEDHNKIFRSFHFLVPNISYSPTTLSQYPKKIYKTRNKEIVATAVVVGHVERRRNLGELTWVEKE